jgi:hypothetical protein
MLEHFEFAGKAQGLMPWEQTELDFVLFVAEDVDKELLPLAAESLARFLANEQGMAVESFSYN